MRNILFYTLFFSLNVVSGKLCKTCEDHIDCRYYCCDNFELKDGKCQECKIGFTSMKGNACLPCNGMWYGEKCGLKCHCSSYQICHKEHGCMTATSVETTKKGITGYITTTGFPHSVEIKDNHIYQCRRRNYMLGRCNAPTCPIKKTMENYNGRMTSKNLLIYIGITGCSALTFGICVICRQRTMNRVRQIKNFFKTSPLNGNKLQVPDEKNLTGDDSFKHVSDEQYVVENALYEEVQ